MRGGIAMLLMLAACGDSGSSTQTFTPATGTQAAVQKAFIDAKPGDTIEFGPGTYMFSDELSISKADITVKGTGGAPTDVVFDFKGQMVGGNGLNVNGDGFTIENLTVRDTAGSGVRVTKSKNVTMRKVHVVWSGEPKSSNGGYGLYPVQCMNVLIDECLVSGASDAGIYVGQSNYTVVRNSTIMSNQAGLEIENTTDAEVANNIAMDNVNGILVFNLPQLQVKTGTRSLVHDNMIIGNNRAGFATPGSIVSYLPSGEGMLLLGNDNTEVRNNTISGHNNQGIAVISCATAEGTTGGAIDCNDSAYDPWAEGIYIHDNTFTNNGQHAEGFFSAIKQPGVPLQDILWDGLVDPAKTDTDGKLKLCLQNNGSATFAKIDVELIKIVSTDATPYSCAHTALAPLTVSW